MELLNERTLAATGRVKRVHFFNTFFATKLAEGVSVRRWARRFDIVELDKLIVPVHVRSHPGIAQLADVGDDSHGVHTAGLAAIGLSVLHIAALHAAGRTRPIRIEVEVHQ